jgi:hypothetical protein
VSLAKFRRSRTSQDVRAFDPIERLSTAVRRLEAALWESENPDEPDVRRELAAVNGAVALGRYGAAALRTERLVTRLRDHG